jgi:hypothetical protein
LKTANQLIEEYDWEAIWKAMAHLGMVDGFGGHEYTTQTEERTADGSLVERDGKLFIRGPVEECS